MYFIAPLLFWACAEMTCGFFILCVPCLPSMIKESGLSGRIKHVLGISADSSGKLPSNHDLVTFGGTGGPASSGKKSKGGKSLNDTYYKIDEEEGSMGDGGGDRHLQTSESQERLHMQQRGANGGSGAHIVRTTQVAVTSDSRSAQSASESGDNSMPWANVRGNVR